MRENNCVALVVTYNRKDLLQETIGALRQQKTLCDIVIVNNGSTDGTEQILEEMNNNGDLIVINTGMNLGGAGGFNRALKEAMHGRWDYFWLMDDDCIPQQDALNQLLVQAEKNPSFGFLSSKVLWTDGQLCEMNKQKLQQGSLMDAGIQPCRQATFVSFFTSRSAIEQAGYPISDFFIWGDDVEFSRRLSALRTCWYVPQSVVVHKTAANTGSDISKDSKERLNRYRYAYRNEVYIARQEGGIRWMYQAAKIVYHSGKVLLQAKSEKRRRLGIIWSSSWEGLSFNPKVEREK